MRALLVVLLFGGCIEANLTPCGDLACPAGDVCIAAGRCVSPDQLSSCAELAPGADCTVGGIGGKCLDGACTPGICGNGVLDPGEVCDDGNQSSGDGCSGTCTSKEICGNGVIDISRGEGCDCGTGANPSSLCVHANSDDPSAECTMDCKPRFCGDGTVNTIEQCDGNVPAAITCQTFGYYRGAPTCSNLCQVSPATCEGRCGDSVLDPDNGEFCDGPLPTGTTCLTFGLDLGALRCGPVCGPALDSCGVLTWTRAHGVIDHVRDVWGGSAMLGVIYDSGDTYARYQGTWAKAPGTFRAVTGTQTAVWAVGSASVAKWTAATGWVVQTPPWSAATAITDAWASDALGLFVSESGTATIHRLVGTTWATLPAPNPGQQFEATRSELWVHNAPLAFAQSVGGTFGGQTYGLFLYNGTMWTAVAFSAREITEDTLGRVWAIDQLDVTRRVGAAWETLGAAMDHLISDGPTAIGSYAIGDGIQVTSELRRYGYPGLVITDATPLNNGDARIIADDSGMIFALANDGIYALRHGAWRQLPDDLGTPPPPHADTYVDVSTSTGRMVADTGEWVPLPLPSICSIATRFAGITFAGCAEGLYVDGVVEVSGMRVWQLWSDGGTQRAAVGENLFDGEAFGGVTYGIAYTTGSGAWQAIPSPVPNQAIDGIIGGSIGDLYALRGTDLYHHDGTSWTLATSNVFGTPAVTPTRIIIRADIDEWVQYSRATGVVTPFDTPPYTRAIASTGGEEIFALAPPAVGGSILYRLEAGVWSPVRIPPGVDIEWAFELTAFGKDLVIRQAVGPSPAQYFQLQRTGPW